MKKLFIALFVVILSFNVVTAFAQEETKVKKNNDYIVYSGRWMNNAAGMHSGWQATCKISFTGTLLKISGSGKVFVQIDNQEPVDFTLSDDTVVAQGLAEGEHTAIIMAQTYSDKMTIKGFTLDKDASVIPSKWVPTVECIGDSLSSGGFENDKGSPFLVKLGYPYFLGKKLGWNVYSVAQSGIPLCENERTGEGRAMSIMYDYWSMHSSDALNKDKAIEKHPDYIILKLGANDWYQYVSKEKWIQTNIDFITHLLEKHPNAVIFVVSPFTFTRVEDTKTAVEHFNSDKVVFVDPTNWGYQQYRISDNCHFGKEGNIFIADKFYDVIMNYVSTHATPTATATVAPTTAPTAKPTEQATAQATAQATDKPLQQSTPTATQQAQNQEGDFNALPFIAGGAAVCAAGGAAAVIIKKKKDKKDKE